MLTWVASQHLTVQDFVIVDELVRHCTVVVVFVDAVVRLPGCLRYCSVYEPGVLSSLEICRNPMILMASLYGAQHSRLCRLECPWMFLPCARLPRNLPYFGHEVYVQAQVPSAVWLYARRRKRPIRR